MNKPTFPELREKINKLLEDNGYGPAEFSVDDSDAIEISFSVEIEERELPDILKPFLDDSYHIERAM